MAPIPTTAEPWDQCKAGAWWKEVGMEVGMELTKPWPWNRAECWEPLALVLWHKAPAQLLGCFQLPAAAPV